jgi:hypothetical protein
VDGVQLAGVAHDQRTPDPVQVGRRLGELRQRRRRLRPRRRPCLEAGRRSASPAG